MPKQNLTNSQFIRRKSVGYFNEGGEADKEELEKQARLDTYRTEQANDALASLINSYRMTGRGAEDIARITGLPVEELSRMFGATDTTLPSAELQENRLGEFRDTTPGVMTDEGTRLRPGYELRSVPKDLMGPTGRESLEEYVRRFNIRRSGVNPRVQMFEDGGEVSNDDFIRQMTVGTLPANQEVDPNVIKDLVRGVQYTPFDVLGAPVDIATMVMRPFGYNVEKPVGGSDWFIEQAAKRGLAQPSTGSGAELLGRIAGGVTTPAAAKGVGKVAAKTEDFISGQLDTAAKKVEDLSLAKLREQTGNPNLSAKEVYDAMFAAQAPGVPVVKPKGGNVFMENIDMVDGRPVRSSPIDKMRPTVTLPGGKDQPETLFASEFAARLKEQISRNEKDGNPTEYMRRLLDEVEPKAALDNWIQTKLSKYIRTDMGTEGDPVRKLAEEMSTKVRADYEAGLKRIAKMKDNIAKAKAAGKNTGASEAELAAEIDKVENAYRQTSMLPVSIGPYTHPSSTNVNARAMAGFPEEPISKSSLAKEWEEVADRQFYLHRAGDLVEGDTPAFKANPWLANINPEEIVYTAPYVDEMHMFTHTLDELENALRPGSGLPPRLQLKPEDMQQLGIEKAFRLVNDINDWRLEQRIALNLEEAKRAAVTVKQYPDAPGGLQWQELKAPTYTELPPGYTVEQLDYATSVLKGPDGKTLTYFGSTDGPASNHQKEALSFLAKNDLERALKYEGSTMRHCVGGYCDDVWSGQTRIYSLRDSKGEPHVTIETAPRIRGVYQNIETFLQENPGNITSRLGFDADDFLYARQNASQFNPEAERELDRFFNAVQNNPEFNQWSQSRPVEERVLQIKGKANQKPTEKYIPFVQDFLSSQRWYSIGDRENADLVPLQPTLLKNAQDRGFTPNVVTTAGDQPYITKEEFNRLAKLFGGVNEYAAGGEVSTEDFIEQMTVGTRPTDQGPVPYDQTAAARFADYLRAPVDLAQTAVRGTIGSVVGPAYGLYKGVTGGKYGTAEGVREASTAGGELMQKITGEPKSQAAKDFLQFLGEKAEALKLAPMPQLMTAPIPGRGAVRFQGEAAKGAVEDIALRAVRSQTQNPDITAAQLYNAMLGKQAPGAAAVKPTAGVPAVSAPKNQMGFYSAVEDTILNLPQEKGTAQQFLAQISKAPGVKQGELKATGLEEFLKSKGTAPVTREEVRRFLDGNKVQVDEVVLGAGQVLSPEAKRLADDANSRMADIYDEKMLPFFQQLHARNESLGGQDPFSVFSSLRGRLGIEAINGDQEAINKINALNLPPDIKQAVFDYAAAKQEYQTYAKQSRRMEKPKFEKYNIPGGENAREIYLTLPFKESSIPEGYKVTPVQYDDGTYGYFAETPTTRSQVFRTEQEAMNRLQEKITNLRGFRENQKVLFNVPGSHSVSPEADRNRLAHIFLDDRTDAEGKKVLFVQELQSDWAQQGRDKGFKGDSAEAKKAFADFQKELVAKYGIDGMAAGKSTPEENAKATRLVEAVVKAEHGLAPAPFVTNTEDWVNLALKRVINEAVENGYDKVAFISGQQAAKKYSLSTVLDAIEVSPLSTTYRNVFDAFASPGSRVVELKQKGGGIIEMYVNKEGTIEAVADASFRRLTGKPLSEAVGKEMAEKVMATELKDKDSTIFTVKDMEVGGEGMKGFYDNVLPKTANKLLAKMGSKIEPVAIKSQIPLSLRDDYKSFMDWMAVNHPEVNAGDSASAWIWGNGNDRHLLVREYYDATKPMEQLGFKITPEMVEMVKTKGLPQFAAGGEVTKFIRAHA